MALTVWNDKTVTGQYAGLVAASWKGKTYIRSAPSSVNNNSPAQQAHKQRYAYLYKLINANYKESIKPFFQSSKMTPANMIVKSQNQSFWKLPINTAIQKANLFASIVFPIQNIAINPTISYSSTSGNYATLNIESFSLNQTSGEQITHFNLFGANPSIDKYFIHRDTIDNIENSFLMPIQSFSTNLTMLIWFTSENTSSILYRIAQQKLNPTPHIL